MNAFRIFVAALFAAAGLATSAFAAPGALDRTFGNQGIATFDFTPEEFRNEGGIDMSLQPDGKWVVLSETSNNYAIQYFVTRHLADGSLDASFGIGGRVTLESGSCSTCFNALKLARRTDGSFIVAGTRFISSGASFVAEIVAIRLDASGTLDTTFGTAGYARLNPDGFTRLGDMALAADDRIVLAGTTGSSAPLPPDPLFELMPPQPRPGRWLTARLAANGQPDATFGTAGIAPYVFGVPSSAHAVVIQSDGRILVAGASGNETRLVRYDTASGTPLGGLGLPLPEAATPAVIDMAAGTGVGTGSVFLAISRSGTTYLLKVLENAVDSSFVVPTSDATTLAALPDGGVLLGAHEEVLRFTSNGHPFSTFADDGRLAIAGLGVTRLAILPNGKIAGTGTMQGSTATLLNLALFRIDPSALEFVVTEWIEFPIQSIGTRSFTRQVTIHNTTAAPITISIAASNGFGANECAQIAAGTSCRLSVWFNPTTTSAGFTFAEAITGQLTITSSAGATATVRLDGIVENSLVRHYYRYILEREADAGGAQYWAAEARRIRATMQELSGAANVNVAEVWYAMALEFYRSPEFQSRLLGNGSFVMNLYQLFFNRIHDPEGFAYWLGQLDSGLPREAVINSFMLSPEFAQFNATFFGAAPNRPEIDIVFDMYRGLLGRLPDEGGLRYWVGRLQGAQCVSATRVHAEVEGISSQFANGPEYAARTRATRDYVVDLYNAFMRRGADLQGLDFWVQQINSGAVSREDARRSFAASPEFSARVQAIVSTPCR